MAKFLLSMLISLWMLSSCSLDSFDVLYNVTSSLKENVAIASGIVDVDTTELLETIESAVTDFTPIKIEEGRFELNGYTIEFFVEGVDEILPPLDTETLYALDSASTNSVKVKAATKALSETLDDNRSLLAKNTISFINTLIYCFDVVDFESLYAVFAGFSSDPDRDLVERDLLSLRILLYVIGTSLTYFEAEEITINDIMEALRDVEEIPTDYIDCMALSLGLAKSASKTSGDSAFVKSLNNVLTYFLESVV